MPTSLAVRSVNFMLPILGDTVGKLKIIHDPKSPMRLFCINLDQLQVGLERLYILVPHQPCKAVNVHAIA